MFLKSPKKIKLFWSMSANIG